MSEYIFALTFFQRGSHQTRSRVRTGTGRLFVVLPIAVVVIFCLLVAVIPPCAAQTTTSTITGRITDPTEAVIPAAQVSVVNVDSGVTIEVESNESGLYRVPSLSPGSYRVEVESSGFQRLVRSGIVLQISQVLQVDLVMQLGAITETIDVTGSAPVVESQTSSVSQLVERSMIEGMPLGNRTATSLVVLTPGAYVVNPGGFGAGFPIFGISGGRVRNQSYSLDGGNVTNVVGLAVPQLQTGLPMDAMQEFRVLSNNYAAEHGHSTSGIVTMSTRAGTNALHGSLFYYVRNDALDARNFFSATKAPLRQHQFGASIGGPIIKDKTHFFFSWEQGRRVSGGTAFRTVPTALQRSGDFSQTLDSKGKLIPIYDPATTVGQDRQLFPGNVIPANRSDSVAEALTDFWPAPNRSGAITGANNFFVNTRPDTVRNVYVTRIDHQLGPSDRLMVRYFGNKWDAENPGVFGIPYADPNANMVNNFVQSILGGYTHIFNSNLINEFRFTFVKRKNQNISFGLNENSAGQVGLQGVSDVGFPRVTITGMSPLGRTTHFRLQTPIKDTQVQEAISYYRGKHAFKVGFEYRQGSNKDDKDQSSSGTFAFTPLITGLPGKSKTGIAFASFLLGEANSANRIRPDIIHSQAAYWSWYVQDDWRVSERLTLNLGLRWETGTPRTEQEDRMNAFDTTAINPVSGTPGIITFANRDGVPRTAWDTDLNNFGPRFGFAWRPPGMDRTVIRGGGGIFYGPTVSNIVATSAAIGFSTDLRIAATQAGIDSAMRLRDGFPIVPRTEIGPGFGAVPVGAKTTTAVSFFERERAMPMSLQYNFNIQHELRENLMVEVGYISNLSHHLTSRRDLTINQVPPELMGSGNAQIRRPYPQYTNVTVINPPLGNSTYHGFTVKTEKRYGVGLTLLAHYTFSKFIDDAESFSEYGDAQSYMDAYNRGLDKSLSGSDIPHRAVISGVYELPFLRDSAGALANVLGGWKIGLIASFQSGPPFTVYNKSNTTNAFSAGPLRPNLVGDPTLPESERTIHRWFNTDAFAAPAQYTFGDSPRSVLRGPGRINMDLSLLKVFEFTERWKMEVRGESFNFLNRVNFNVPAHSLGTASFGIISGAQSARVIQLGLRLTF